MSIERVLFFVLFICLATRSQAVVCPDLCNATASTYMCSTFSVAGSPGFLTAAANLNVWFSATMTSLTSFAGSSLMFTNQKITVGSQTFSPPDSEVNINSAGSASTTFAGGRWVTTAGTGCGDAFLGGLSVPTGPLGITGGTFQWCGVISSATNPLPAVQWKFGAVVYETFSQTYTTVNPRATSSTSCQAGGAAPNFAGQPSSSFYYVAGNIKPGGTKNPESLTDPVGVQSTVSTPPCWCEKTNAPTRAPTSAPTKAPTTAPTPAPTVAPTLAPTSAPTRTPTEAPTSRPTVAPTPPTDAPTIAPTVAPTSAPTRTPTEAPTSRPTVAPTPPTDAPTSAPTTAPTERPTKAPTTAPTTRPTVAPTPPTDAPTSAPTTAPTERPTKAPTTAPTTRPTVAPTPPTGAPTSAPTTAPTERPTKAPTTAPTTRPTSAPTPPTDAPTGAPTTAPTERPTRAPTEAPTDGPTNAPTPPTEAPTVAPTEAPTERPTRAPTEAPTTRPTTAPTPPTEAPTGRPTRAPTDRPTVSPTEAPSVAPTEAPTAPTLSPTVSPTPPTNRPTRAPTAPTIPPPTNAPTTAAPTAPIDPCTRQFTATFTLTYDQMTNGYVTGTIVYDYSKNVLAFHYTNQSYQEIYKFNSQYGYGNTNNQEVYKISPNGTCAPCSRYQNQWAFPAFWNISGVANPYPNGPVGADGCTNYTVPSSNNNWAQYFGLRADGSLCYISNQGRLFNITNVKYCSTYDNSYITPPFGCTCNTPQDIAFSLDRSSSIFTESTYLYREFLQQFVNSYNFDPTAPTTSTQMGIVQWGNILNEMNGLFPVGRFGSVPFTMDPVNINAAVQNVGCTGVPCNFCGGNSNDSYCIFPTVSKTCTSCGLYGAAKLFTDTNFYKKRATSSQVIIVITDGNANTLNSSWSETGSELCCGDGDFTTGSLIPGVSPNCDDGLYQTYFPLGCFSDILAVKSQVLSMVPGVTIFAIGVGPLVNIDTLKVIANNDNNAFVAPDFKTLLEQIQSIVTLTCVEPHPITSCGTGAAACGFCACGQTKLPDGIIPANLCDAVDIVPQAQCFTRVPTPLNCPKKPCETATCNPNLNNGTGGCVWGPTVCNQPDPCFVPACINGICIGKAVCNASKIGCCPTPAPTTAAPVGTPPTAAPTLAPECLNSTAGLGCGPNADCNVLTGLCECIDGFHGVLCQFEPGQPECLANTECDDSDPCTEDICDPKLGVCTNFALVCDDGDACTLDFCNATGCQNVPNVPCDDGDGCSTDFCNTTTGLCQHVWNNCTEFTDVCNIGYCDPKAPKDAQCFQQSVTCPRENNCTIAFCLVNGTDVDGKTIIAGCTNQTLDCTNLGGVIAGIAAGVIAAIAAAGAIAGLALAGGGAYAVANTISESAETETIGNPLYEAAGTEGVNALYQV